MNVESTYICPSCDSVLRESSLTSGSLLWGCTTCSGVLLGTASLRVASSRKQYRALWGAFRAQSYASPRRCPVCRSGLRTFAGPDGDNPVQLETCAGCLLLWFDPGELEKLGIEVSMGSPELSRSRAALELTFAREDAQLRELTDALVGLAYDFASALRRLL
jgi:Zn-finger nucleic acid-binding protein